MLDFIVSHEATISGWDEFIVSSFKSFNKIINDIPSVRSPNGKKKTSFLRKIFIKIFHKKEIISPYHKDFLEMSINQIHDIINKIVLLQNEKNAYEIINAYETINEHLKEIIGLCVLSAQFSLFKDNGHYRMIWDTQIHKNRKLMIQKNKAYGSSWSIMRPEGIIDVIHTKVHRIISLLEGTENPYESILDSYEDILNYCVFCHLKMKLTNKHQIS